MSYFSILRLFIWALPTEVEPIILAFLDYVRYEIIEFEYHHYLHQCPFKKFMCTIVIIRAGSLRVHLVFFRFIPFLLDYILFPWPSIRSFLYIFFANKPTKARLDTWLIFEWAEMTQAIV